MNAREMREGFFYNEKGDKYYVDKVDARPGYREIYYTRCGTNGTKYRRGRMSIAMAKSIFTPAEEYGRRPTPEPSTVGTKMATMIILGCVSAALVMAFVIFVLPKLEW